MYNIYMHTYINTHTYVHACIMLERAAYKRTSSYYPLTFNPIYIALTFGAFPAIPSISVSLVGLFVELMTVVFRVANIETQSRSGRKLVQRSEGGNARLDGRRASS